MTTRLLGIALGVVLFLAAGFFAWPLRHHLTDGPGQKLRRECESLVDTVLDVKGQTVPTEDLRKELASRGVSAPAYPTEPFLPIDKSPEQRREHELAVKQYDAEWEEVRRHPSYEAAWEVVHAKKRQDAVNNCIVIRAKREGVVIR